CWAALAVVALTASCPRPCESSDNCKRTCSCINAITHSRVDCPIAFRCDSESATCENDYANLSCDDICTQFAKHDECGFERCAVDADCTKNLSCPVLDQNGNATDQQFQCTLTFACDEQKKLCDVNSTLGTDALCDVCRQQAAQQSGG
ncbi:MAG TPA: hypothetical protein VGO62_01600, partial [Myxococcota bacterium]